jgi:PAS domain S-box-containing protein
MASQTDPNTVDGKSGPTAPQTAVFRHAVAACALAAGLVALVGLAGYASGQHLLASLRLDYIPIAPDTALSFLVLSGLLLTVATGRLPALAGRLAAVVAGLVAVHGLLAGVEHLSGIALTAGHLLYPVVEQLGPHAVGRMSPLTGGLFLLAGAATALLMWPNSGRRARDAASALGALVGVGGFIAAIGYLFNAPLLYGSEIIPIAALTASDFVLLGAALAAAAGPAGLVLRPFAGTSVRAQLLRTFVPLTAVVLLCQSYLHELVAEPLGIGSSLASALLVLLLVPVAVIAVARASRGLARTLEVAEAQRCQAEDELRQSHQRLQALIDAAPLAIFTLADDNTIQSWNPAAERTFGWRAEDVIGRPPPMVTPETQAEYQQLRERLRRGGALTNYEGQRRRRDGSPVDLSISTAPVVDRDGRISGTIYLAADVSERKQAEERFLQAQKMEAVGRLTAGIAHDFNNLLTAINGFTELAQLQVAPDDPVCVMLGRIANAGRQAADLVRQLMVFSRKQDVQPRVLDLNATVCHMDQLLRRIIGEDIALTTIDAPGLWPVKADPTQLEQVLANLVVNARDAMPGGGHLTIETANVTLDELSAAALSAAHPGDYVCLSVTDDGVGISDEVRAHLFEPYFTTKEYGKGTGLGLATVYGIVQQHGGHVHVYSELGRGTTFKVYFPRTLEMPDASCGDQPSSQPAGGGETIMLVEDNPEVRSLAHAVLAAQGYQLLTADNAEAALGMLSGHGAPIHLLLTDVVMPGCSGTELADRIRALHPGIKVLFMSGYAEDAVARHGLLAEGMAFLPKPFNALDLARQVRRVLDA